MESKYEKLTTSRTNHNKGSIDFYKTSSQEHGQVDRQGLPLDVKNPQDEIQFDLQVESIHLNQHKNANAITYEQATNKQYKILKDSREKVKKGNENRRLSQEKSSTYQDKELLQQRQKIEINARNFGGAKSALNNYGMNEGNLSAKSKNQTEEKKDGSYQLSGGQAQTMTKSQSQNKNMFASTESFSLKNQQISGINKDQVQDKLNQIKEKQSIEKNRLSNAGQDGLFKQHQQYSQGNQKKQGAYQLKSNNHVLSNCSTGECTFCKTKGYHSHSLGAAPCQSIYCRQHQSQILISNKLSEKYSNNRDYYNVKIINDLIYNENTHIVSIFKDYLILDDINEFLKRSYNYQETKLRLPKLCSFYDKYSQVFPNFVVLPESKYMFKNIQRKQKLIDEQYQLQDELARKQHQTLLEDDKLFNSKFYNSVYKMDLSMTRQQYEEQAKQICTQAGKKQILGLFGKIEDMKIEELVDRFIVKDSESNIQLATLPSLDMSGFSNYPIQMEKMSRKNSEKKSQGNNKNAAHKEQPKKANQPLAKKNQQPEMVHKKAAAPISVHTNVNQKTQKGSFNSNNNKMIAAAKMEINKNIIDSNSSQKTTPKLIKSTAQTLQGHIQTSPDTKQALNAYLQNCQIEEQKAQVLDNTIKYGDMYGSPYNKSPAKQSSNKFQNLLSQGSQTTMGLQPNNLTSSLALNRHQMKSQANLVVATNLAQTQQVSKKNTRFSTGEQILSKTQQSKKGVSPIPQNLQAAYPNNCQALSSRNVIGQQSIQKSFKQINSHAKYLSGGNEYYQKMLNDQHTYTSSETVMSGGDSSNKKIMKQKIGNFGQMDLIKEHLERPDEVSEHDIITGDDCGEDNIADERLGSPDAFSSEEFERKSLEGHQYIENQQMNQFFLTSSDEKMMLSQYTNYDQIKKHLEKYITVQQQESNQNQSSTLNRNIKSGKKLQDQDHFARTNNQVLSSVSGSYTENNSSRNGTGQKQLESLKQKIREAFDQGEIGIDTGIKTPNKSSTHSTKSKGISQNNRMSIESKDIILNTQSIQACLSSTSAAGRTLSFSQTGFTNPNNYRSITNLQQRQGNSNVKEKSMNDSKRMSQNRQSFKDSDQSQTKIIKRCATGKTLSINEAHQHAFTGSQQPGFLKQVASSGTLLNPTFINNISNQGNKFQHIQNQQQAANTVRVMTPSYSLASLSKLVTPTTSTSPMTMTVTLAGSSQSRKQEPMKKSNIHIISQPHKQSSSGGNTQTFLLSDKNNKIISNQKNTQNIVTTKSAPRATTKQVSIQGAAILPQKTKQVTLVQSNSQQNLQITPRSIVTPHESRVNLPKCEIIQESSNLSCTVSTEHNSGKFSLIELIYIVAKTIESKHPKFMRTIEEVGVVHAQSYNNILSSSLAKKSQFGIQASQAHFDLKAKAKMTATAHQKKTAGTQQLPQSQGVQHFKSPNQQIQNKKAGSGKY